MHDIFFSSVLYKLNGFTRGLGVKNPPANVEDIIWDVGLLPGSGRPLQEGNGNPLQYSCLGSPMGRRAWWARVHGGHKESDTTKYTLRTYLDKERGFCPSDHNDV